MAQANEMAQARYATPSVVGDTKQPAAAVHDGDWPTSTKKIVITTVALGLEVWYTGEADLHHLIGRLPHYQLYRYNMHLATSDHVLPSMYVQLPINSLTKLGYHTLTNMQLRICVGSGYEC